MMTSPSLSVPVPDCTNTLSGYLQTPVTLHCALRRPANFHLAVLESASANNITSSKSHLLIQLLQAYHVRPPTHSHTHACLPARTLAQTHTHTHIHVRLHARTHRTVVRAHARTHRTVTQSQSVSRSRLMNSLSLSPQGRQATSPGRNHYATP